MVHWGSRLVMIALLLTMASSLALAQETAATSAAAREVYIGGTLFVRMHTSWAGRTPEQRAAQLQERFNQALAQGPIHPEDITVGQMQGDWVVELHGARFLTADPVTARFDHATPEQLANQWAVRMRELLPPLTRPTYKKEVPEQN